MPVGVTGSSIGFSSLRNRWNRLGFLLVDCAEELDSKLTRRDEAALAYAECVATIVTVVCVFVRLVVDEIVLVMKCWSSASKRIRWLLLVFACLCFLLLADEGDLPLHKQTPLYISVKHAKFLTHDAIPFRPTTPLNILESHNFKAFPQSCVQRTNPMH